MIALVPVALLLLVGLLALTSRLEQRRVEVFVRLAVRTDKVGPDTAELVIAEELGRVLANAGLGRKA